MSTVLSENPDIVLIGAGDADRTAGATPSLKRDETRPSAASDTEESSKQSPSST
ncbi:hypothetical protein [Mesorhizobium wenxiniae]|uniref:hypothetical protein n=1 Tax=Mesorhizobium wenxiniae TaxID=2014805 RepID=UPI0013FDA23D|nr:hypothetical protein [Mesorhizobium wenxiniae]